MITVRLKGGMGNQMFQYAFAKATAKRLGTTFQMDCSLLLDRARGDETIYRDYDLEIFNIEKRFLTRPETLKKIYRLKFSKIGKLLRSNALKGKDYYKEPFFHLDKKVLDSPTDETLYDGWWQAPAYFENVKEELRQDFGFVEPVIASSQELQGEIQATNSVCLNVRRTDFLTNPALNSTNKAYFEEAVEYIKSSIESPSLFIFSDDMEWCKANLRFDIPYTFVSHDHKGWKFGNYFQLMADCKHFVIPNSSFAWWAVWLSNHSNQVVVAPKNWFATGDISSDDLVPDDWVRI